MGIKYVKMQVFNASQVPTSLYHMIIQGEKMARFMKFAGRYGITLFFTPMYPEAIDLCDLLGVDFYKIRFGDRNNKELHDKLKDKTNLIFVSTQNISDTIYSGKNIRYLYCAPEYPADLPLYDPAYSISFHGISDHTKDFMLYRSAKKYDGFDWFEMHVCLDDLCVERPWSKKLDELKKFI